MLDGALTTAMQSYISAFNADAAQFTQWGQWIFCGLLTINMMWFWLWLAFQKGEFDENLAVFLKKFCITLIFYTLMMQHQWLLSILQSVQSMGQTLTHAPSDPSSIVNDGIALGNQVLNQVVPINLFNITIGSIIIFLVYLVIVLVFIDIALRLALATIETTALVALSSFFLSFAALDATSKIANNMLEAIIANSVKLLGIYLVVGTGMHVIVGLANQLPAQETSFDDYWWLLAAVLLLWMLSKQLPEQLARIVGFAVSSDDRASTAVISMGVTQHTRTAVNLAKSLIKPSRK